MRGPIRVLLFALLSTFAEVGIARGAPLSHELRSQRRTLPRFLGSEYLANCRRCGGLA
jgi:hypothetical protein